MSVIHRVGLLQTGDEIVLVGISSAHRGDAYHANEFIMDFLKSKSAVLEKKNKPIKVNVGLKQEKAIKKR